MSVNHYGMLIIACGSLVNNSFLMVDPPEVKDARSGLTVKAYGVTVNNYGLLIDGYGELANSSGGQL